MEELNVPDLTAIARALKGAPISFDAPPHVYSVCCPRFEAAPGVERERLDGDDLRLYLHIPFCAYKCTFCSYAIRVGAKRELMERYVEALATEMEWIEPGTRLSQLFVGGGTPTALPPDLLDAALEAAFGRVDRSEDAIHTCESSPDTITQEHVDVLLKHGIRRVSMGVQSLHDGVLDDVDRAHSSQQAVRTLRMLSEAGVVLNADLIYGLPGQDEEGFRDDVRALADAGVTAMTLYDLRINDKTTVARALEEEEILNLERLVRWRTLVRDVATDVGFVQTRWHTYKRKGSVALEHRWMPTFTDASHGFQMGVGNSARSHLGYTVYRNVRRPEKYIDLVSKGESPVESVFRLTAEDRRALYIARSIGDGGALDRDHYESIFGRSLDRDNGENLQVLERAGLVEDDGTRISLTAAGKLVHDRVTLLLFPKIALDVLREKQGRIEDRFSIRTH